MTRARIFISHSCKDVEIADDVPFEDEDRPAQAAAQYARHIRDEVERLLGDDFEVLLDRKLLDPGDRWSIKLKRWLGECDGAVLLLSEDAIESKWVLQEATILTWRRHLRRISGLFRCASAASPTRRWPQPASVRCRSRTSRRQGSKARSVSRVPRRTPSRPHRQSASGSGDKREDDDGRVGRRRCRYPSLLRRKYSP